MKRIHIAIIAGAVLVTAVLIAFGPSTLARYQQAKIDDSLACGSWRLEKALLEYRDAEAALGNAQRVSRKEWDALERERKDLGCSPK